MAEAGTVRIIGAVHIAGALTLGSDDPPRRLLETAGETLVVTVGREPGGGQPFAVITNRSGRPMAVTAADGSALARIELGETTIALPLAPDQAVLALQAISVGGTPASGGEAISLVLSADRVGSRIEFIGQLFTRRFGGP